MKSLLQFSLRHLLVAVAFVAVAITALLNANEWWVGGIWFGSLVLLSAATLLAIHRRHDQRAFWLGCAVFGWISVVAGTQLVPILNLASQLPQLAMVHLYDLLPDARRCETIDDPSWPIDGGAAAPPPPAIPTGMEPTVTTPGPIVPLEPPGPIPTPAPQVSNPHYVPLDAFLNIGEAIWRVLFAFIGGFISLFAYCTRPRE